MSKRMTALLLCLFLALASAEAGGGPFSNYDFTFYETVSESLNIMDSSSIGFDYTLFGFAGEEGRHGLFMRIGVQTPYSTLSNIVESRFAPKADSQDDSSLGIIMGSDDEPETNEFRFTFLIGPALRYVFNASFDSYAGIGIKAEEHIVTLLDLTGSTSWDTSIAFDFDAGFKFNLEENTSCRLGIYGTFEIASYNYTTWTGGDGSSNFSTGDIKLNLIASGESRTPMEVFGYISLGKTFSSSDSTEVWRYSNSTARLGGGTMELVGVE